MNQFKDAVKGLIQATLVLVVGLTLTVTLMVLFVKLGMLLSDYAKWLTTILEML